MAKIETAISNIIDASKHEREMFTGAEERKFFIELLNSKDVDKLLEEFNTDEYNSSWDEERQKKNPDIDKIMKARRSIAFLASAKKGLYKKYKETELLSHVMGVARTNRTMNLLKKTEYFTTMDSYKKR